jgi:hypothetical protein
MTKDAYLPADARVRVETDRQLVACDWEAQIRDQMNRFADSRS